MKCAVSARSLFRITPDWQQSAPGHKVFIKFHPWRLDVAGRKAMNCRIASLRQGPATSFSWIWTSIASQTVATSCVEGCASLSYRSRDIRSSKVKSKHPEATSTKGGCRSADSASRLRCAAVVPISEHGSGFFQFLLHMQASKERGPVVALAILLNSGLAQ